MNVGEVKNIKSFTFISQYKRTMIALLHSTHIKCQQIFEDIEKMIILI